MKNEVIIGDCAEVLKQFEDESIDCIVTDPPYGYSFMGLSWDKALPSLEALKECNRVLKPGAFGFFMCAPRMDVLWRMGQRLEEAGFRVDFSFISHCYASGFPKAQDTSKAIDKRFGAERQIIGKKIDVSTGREMSAKQAKAGNGKGINEGWDRPWRADDEHCEKLTYITAPATEEAKHFNGAYSGLQLKPALEVIICVMKPFDKSCKTYVDQALQNGHGVSWLGDCKIPYGKDSEWQQHIRKDHGLGNSTDQYKFTDHKKGIPDSEGRFPANLLVSDNCLDRGIIDKGTKPHPLNSKKDKYEGWGSSLTKKEGVIGNYGDSGDFSRYFSLDAWFDKKLQELPPEQQKTFPFLITPKPSKSEKNKYIENKHPTVKPLKLMSYLITMGSREGDLILDPFAGSGTTLEAAKLLNRQFIGIDKDEANKPLMEARGQLNSVSLEAFAK